MSIILKLRGHKHQKRGGNFKFDSAHVTTILLSGKENASNTGSFQKMVYPGS